MAQNSYLYASARIRALEASLVGRERLQALLELPDAAAVMNALAAAGLFSAREAQNEDAEALLIGVLKNGFATVAGATGNAGLSAFLQYAYDCHNLRSLLKCELRGVDPMPLFMDVGTVPVSALVAGGQIEGLPRHMAAAVPEAREAFAKTGNPQEIDFALDKACFADMAKAAKVPFAAEYVRRRADLVNLTVCLRVLRSGATPVTRALLSHALVPGGTLPAAWFMAVLEAGEPHFFDALAPTPYAALGAEGARTASQVEKNADDCLMAFVQTAKFVPFGAEVAIGYLVGLETAVKNIRIVLAGKAAGLSADVLRQRVRESYV